MWRDRCRSTTGRSEGWSMTPQLVGQAAQGSTISQRVKNAHSVSGCAPVQARRLPVGTSTSLCHWRWCPLGTAGSVCHSVSPNSEPAVQSMDEAPLTADRTGILTCGHALKRARAAMVAAVVLREAVLDRSTVMVRSDFRMSPMNTISVFSILDTGDSLCSGYYIKASY